MTEQDKEFRPTKFNLSNAEVESTGILCGGAVANIARELVQLREVVYTAKPPRELGNDRHYTDCPAHQHRLDTRTGDHSEGCDCVAGNVYQDLAREAGDTHD